MTLRDGSQVCLGDILLTLGWVIIRPYGHWPLSVRVEKVDTGEWSLAVIAL